MACYINDTTANILPYYFRFMKNKCLGFLFSLLLFLTTLSAQTLKPGFDKSEYIEMMQISSRFGNDSSYFKDIPISPQYHFVYRSPAMGLENRWDLWISDSAVAVISIRGTTENSVSWLANFYAAMVPAKGELKLSENETFKYELASDPQAAVHVGWLISTAFLAKDILPKIDSCYKQGIRNMLITGHSQGGAIGYLLTAYLYNLQKQHSLPSDIRFKTYCSAGPKPDNLYFAYEYEAITQNGWAYNVVNSADWVPEVPFSIQTIKDFNPTNPFVNAKAMIKKQKFPKNWALKYVYNKLSKPATRAQKNYQKYLGKFSYKSVQKSLAGYQSPQYYNSNHYVRTGTIVILLADDDYFKLYPESKDNAFVHHLHQPYLYLAKKLNDQAH